MSQHSAFSLRNSKVHKFLCTLDKELEKYTEQELNKITHGSVDQIQKRKIELMFKVEQRRFEEMKKYQQQNTYIIERDSSKQVSVLSPDFQPIFKEVSKNVNIDTSKKQRKISGIVPKQQASLINAEKRLSLKVSYLQQNENHLQNPINNFKMSGMLNFHLKQNIFDVDEDIEIESVESLISEDEKCSVDSEQLEEEFSIDFSKEDTFKKNSAIITIVKEKKITSQVKPQKPLINILAFFEQKIKTSIALDEEHYNYCVICVDNVIQDKKLFNEGNQLYLEGINEQSKSTKLYMQIQENIKLNFSNNFQSSYQMQAKQNINVQKLHNNFNKEFSFDFQQNYFVHKIYENSFGSFINLNSKKFIDNLILEQDMVFMFNYRHGLCVKEIVKTQDKNQLEDFLDNKYEKCNFLPLDLDFKEAKDFYKKFLVPNARSFYTEKNFLEFNLKNFQQLSNEYFKKLIVQNKLNFVVIGIVEFYEDYQFYKNTKNYILFYAGLKLPQFFNINDQNFPLIQGKQQQNCENFRDEFFKDFNQFRGSYQLNLGFNKEKKIFYFSYQNNGERYYNLFSQDSSSMIQFRNNSQDFLKEGIWVGLFKFGIFEESQKNSKGVILPYNCYLMFNKNVIHIENKEINILDSK